MTLRPTSRAQAQDPSPDTRSDQQLITAVRGGDTEAYGVLYARHVGAARRLAGHLSAVDADDLVSDAFARVLTVLQRGSGPDLAFRAYLLTAVRRLHVDRVRAGARVRPTDDLEAVDAGEPFRDTALEGFEHDAAARAFTSLPERWQMVLWHTEVEQQKPADLAPLLGISPNSVSALAYRAREGLRQAYLAAHASTERSPRCAWTRDHLGGYVRGALSRRDSVHVRQHLDHCRPCSALLLELTEVNSSLASVLAPLLLAGAGTAYLGSAAHLGSAAGPLSGFVTVLGSAGGRLRDWLTGHLAAAAVTGVTAASVGVVAGWVVLAPHPGSAPAAVLAPADGAAPRRTLPARPQGTKHAPAERRTSSAGAVRPSSPGGVTPTAEAGDPGPSHTPAAPATSDGPGQTATTGTGQQTGDAGHDTGTESPTGTTSTGDASGSVAVRARIVSTAGPAYRIDASVAGLPAGSTATLVASATDGVLVASPDLRCLEGLTTRCTLTTTPTVVPFLATDVSGAPATVTFTVTSASGAPLGRTTVGVGG